jgi:hypothetical protein
MTGGTGMTGPTGGNGGAFGVAFVAVGVGTNTIAYSYDGITYIGAGSPGLTTTNAVAYSPEVDTWVIAGSSAPGDIIYSFDGIHWSAPVDVGLLVGYAAAWSSTRKMFVVGGSTNPYRLAYSSDGVTWTLNTVLNAMTPVAIMYVPVSSTWVLVAGAPNPVWTTTDITSTNSASFSNIGASPGGTGYCVTRSESLILIGVSGNVQTAPLAATPFTNLPGVAFGVGGSTFGCDYGNGTFVLGGSPAGGFTNRISTSTDGATFTPSSTTVFSTSSLGIHYSRTFGFWTAVGAGSVNTIAVSFDNGATWTGLGKTVFSTQGNAVCSRYRIADSIT